MKRRIQADPPGLAGVEQALIRARQRAREIAARTGTPVVYYENGKIVYEMISAEDGDRKRRVSKKTALRTFQRKRPSRGRGRAGT